KLKPQEIQTTIEIAGERTRVVARFITWPFVLLVLLLVSRSGFFDNWDFPFATVLALALVALYAVTSAWLMRRSCEKTRELVIAELEERRLRITGHLQDVSDE